jgi:hypothetical protein
MRKFYELYSNIGGFDSPKITIDSFPVSEGMPENQPTYPYSMPLQADPYPAIQIPVPASPTDKSANQIYVYGHVFNKQKEPLSNLSINLVSLSTKKDLTEPDKVGTGNDYSAWADSSEAPNIGVKFKGKGYDTLIIPLNTLVISPDVYMTKSFPYWMILLVLGAVALYRKKSRKVGALSSSDIMPIFLIVGGVIGLTLVIKLLKKLGLLPGLAPNEENNPNSPWKPTYWQTFTTYTYALTESVAKQFSANIYNAFGVFSDDYSAILNVFSQMKTKANVSFLAWEFQKQYGVDLLAFLQDGGGILPWDGLSSDHMDNLIKLVDKLPSH